MDQETMTISLERVSGLVKDEWWAYCSMRNPTPKSFVMDVTCGHAGWGATEAAARTKCEESKGSTCEFSDLDSSACPDATETHYMWMNVQENAEQFSTDATAISAVTAALASVEAALSAEMFTTSMEQFFCEPGESDCPSAVTTTTAAAGGTTAGDSGGRRLEEEGDYALPFPQSMSAQLGGMFQLRRRRPSAAPRSPGQIAGEGERGASRRLSAGATTTASGGAGTTEGDTGASTTQGCTTDTPDVCLANGEVPAGWTKAKDYPCVCNLTGVATTTAAVATTTEGDGSAGGGEYANPPGAGGSQVRATSVLTAKEADVEYFRQWFEEARQKAPFGVYYMDVKVAGALGGSASTTAASGRLLSAGGSSGNGVVEVTNSFISGEGPTPGGESFLEEEELSALAIIIVIIAVLLWILLSVCVALYCTRVARRRKRGRDMMGGVSEKMNSQLYVMGDPRPAYLGTEVYVVAFGGPSSQDCHADFLDMRYDLSSLDGFSLQAPGGDDHHRFFSAQAAWFALPFWSKAHMFESISAEEANQKAAEFRGTEDTLESNGGWPNDFTAMLGILESKFAAESVMAQELLSTGDAFLLWHAESPQGPGGFDFHRWSDDCDGEGQNLVGMLLMVIRDRLAGPPTSGTWTLFIKDCYNVVTGRPIGANGHLWQEVVRNARRALVGEELRDVSTFKVPDPEPVREQLREKSQLALCTEGVNYQRLQAHGHLVAHFEDAAKQEIARKAGSSIRPSDVEVELGPGSVLVDAEIKAPRGVPSASIDQLLKANTIALQNDLAQRIRNLPDISMAQEGPEISVIVFRGFPAKMAQLQEMGVEQVAPRPMAQSADFLGPLSREPTAGLNRPDGSPFLAPISRENTNQSRTSGRRPSRPRSMSPEDTCRGKKIPLTYRGGVVTTKV